jgi:hypothetical protein
MRQAAFPGLIARGRDAELAILGSQLDRVRSGVGAVLLMEGGAGMGKSRLLEEGARIAERMSFRVGSGAAEPGEGIVELASLMEALFGGTRRSSTGAPCEICTRFPSSAIGCCRTFRPARARRAPGPDARLPR